MSAEEVREAFRCYVRDGKCYGKRAPQIVQELGEVCTVGQVLEWMRQENPAYAACAFWTGGKQRPAHQGQTQWNEQQERINENASRKNDAWQRTLERTKGAPLNDD